MQQKQALVLAVIAGLLSLLPGWAMAEDKALLQGEWVPVKLVAAGEEAPEEVYKELRIEFAGDEFKAVGLDGEQEVYRFTLDATKDPKWIDLTRKAADEPETMLGIYKLEGNKLTLTFSSPGSVRSTAFESVDDGDSPNLVLMEFWRAEPKPELGGGLGLAVPAGE